MLRKCASPLLLKCSQLNASVSQQQHLSPVVTRQSEITKRVRALRRRRFLAEVSAGLGRLLGPVGAQRLSLEPEPRGEEIAVAAWEGLRLAHEHDWATARALWAEAERAAVVDALHALGDRVGSRSVWLVLGGPTREAFRVDSAAVLDNPLGFATLVDDGLWLLTEGDGHAGLVFARSCHFAGREACFSWEATAWGEPWVSTLRAVAPVVED